MMPTMLQSHGKRSKSRKKFFSCLGHRKSFTIKWISKELSTNFLHFTEKERDKLKIMKSLYVQISRPHNMLTMYKNTLVVVSSEAKLRLEIFTVNYPKHVHE